MAGEFVLVLIPGELLAGKAKTILGEDAHTTIELPYPLLIKVISRITLDITVDVELLVKLFEQHSLIKNPAGRHTLVFTSHRSVTMRYLMTPESLMSVLTPYEVIIATESLSWIAGAVCSTGFWQAAKTQETMTPITMKYLILYIIIYIEDVASPEENTTIWQITASSTS